MDKNKIKSFATWARRNLIKAVSERAYKIGITENNIEEALIVQGGFRIEGKEEIFPLSTSHRDALVREVKEKGFEQVMEEVAYTWFNRFMGLRYMEVNDYLPTGVRVLSSELEGKKEPDAITKVFSIIDELNLDANKVDKLISDNDENGNGKTSIQKQNDIRELYKYILVKECNELGKIIPQMFEKISDYTELLLPDNLLEEGSVIRKMVEDIEEIDFQEEVEIIGWMYQYYISEKKDEVFADLKKNVKITKENIPAATQLFTPKWIVKYMVENSLGRLWLEGHPNEELQKEWKYYLEEAEQEPEVEEELKKIREEHSKLRPEDIKVLDPCMGSGHILVYAFDVLYEIYKTAGYSEREIPRLILQNNLYGLDIDDRAAQLASFALIMKARSFNRRLFREIEREHLELNVCSIQESNSIHKEAIDYFCSLETGLDNDDLENDLEYLWSTFTDAKEYGSILEVQEVNFEALKQRLKEIEQEQNFMFADYRKMLLDKLPIMIKQAEIMCNKYEICVTNPPYMGNNGMRNELLNYIKKNYIDSKADLFAVFIEKCNDLLKNNGLQAMITQHTWMFLSSYERLRIKVVNNDFINMIHLGARAFEEIGGEVVQTTSFVIRKSNLKDFVGSYVKLTAYPNQKLKEENFSNKKCLYYFAKNNIYKIPGSTLAYWISKKYLVVFENGRSLNTISMPKSGLSTTDNNRFLRLWHEPSWEKVYLYQKNGEGTKAKFFPYSKGGEFRRWYGNLSYVVNWNNNGAEIKKAAIGASGGRVVNSDLYFKEYITWTKISTGLFSMRYFPSGTIFSDAGGSLFDKNNLGFLAFTNTKVCQCFLNIINQTLNYVVGSISKLPILGIDSEKVKEISVENIFLSKQDWDFFETSWDFRTHPLLKLLDKENTYRLETAFATWESSCEESFNQLKANEEELNRIFIDIYGLQEELTPEVADKDITIRKADRERDIKSFISYAVGCMFGRYSIDAKGLIYAGGDFKDKWNLADKKVRSIEKDEEGNITCDSWTDVTFVPDFDNVIPITEDEYFEDDMVSRFICFVRTVYSDDNLEDNLDFIADSIGRKVSETSRQAIRRYFIKDFYKDHLKVYQKRPIYWMFESGKNDGFKALVYMHRYNDQTIAKVRTDYLHTLQRKYEGAINRLQLASDSEEYTAKDRTAAKKKTDRISKQIEECREYDEVVAHLANEKISIDLDDGVKVNYAKFQDIKVINSKGKEVKMNLLSKI